MKQTAMMVEKYPAAHALYETMLKTFGPAKASS
jgi:hypothetical protein